jgi:hypothetical protein
LVTAHLFGETALVLTNGDENKFDNRLQITPRPAADPSVIPCNGRVFAISIADGAPVWTRSQRVRQYLFPISQNRNSPAAVLLRRVGVNKVKLKSLDKDGVGEKDKFVNVEKTGIAMIDLRTGRLLFEQSDLPCVRGDPFSQQLSPEENLMVISYQSNLIEARWTDDETGLNPIEQVDVIGDLNIEEYYKKVETIENEQVTPGGPRRPRIGSSDDSP